MWALRGTRCTRRAHSDPADHTSSYGEGVWRERGTRRDLVRRLENKRAIVTGAGAGIGRAIALRMAKEGARLVLADVDEESAEQVAAEIEDDPLAQRTDVIRAEEVEALVRRVVKEWNGLDVMVNNAGVGVAATAPETSEKDYDLV